MRFMRRAAASASCCRPINSKVRIALIFVGDSPVACNRWLGSLSKLWEPICQFCKCFYADLRIWIQVSCIECFQTHFSSLLQER
jgi:hypothetical protein